MRKIIAVGILLLFIVLLLPQFKNVDSKPEKENNIKNTLKDYIILKKILRR